MTPFTKWCKLRVDLEKKGKQYDASYPAKQEADVMMTAWCENLDIRDAIVKHGLTSCGRFEMIRLLPRIKDDFRSWLTEQLTAQGSRLGAVRWLENEHSFTFRRAVKVTRELGIYTG